MKIKVDNYRTVYDYMDGFTDDKITLKGNKINLTRIRNIYDVMGGDYNGRNKENNSKNHK